MFSRRDASGRHRLLLVNGDGTGLTAFTDGGTAVGPDSGDHEPAFAPDGNTVAFARRLADRAILCFAEVGTGAVTERYTASGGDVALPRFAPAMDRIFFGLDDPLAGRAGRRLAFVPIAAGDPVLVWPDERWALEGLELLPTLPALEAGEAPVVLDVDAGEIEIAWGSWGFGSLQQLRAEDGDAYVLRTRATVDHDIAGITCRFELPLPDGLDVLELRIRAVAAVSRVGGDTLLRLSLENYVDGRSDTAVELAPATTGFQTLELRTSSLRHLSRERIVRFHIVAEVERGDPAELKLDFVELAFVRRPEPQ
ncbi:MAG: PD40 domain-containing protein [Planctomycetes bacterium]|nr:PD40 domain-containing protein [Planctomycetota bacterium]